jgi:hypothetical protein
MQWEECNWRSVVNRKKRESFLICIQSTLNWFHFPHRETRQSCLLFRVQIIKPGMDNCFRQRRETVDRVTLAECGFFFLSVACLPARRGSYWWGCMTLFAFHFASLRSAWTMMTSTGCNALMGIIIFSRVGRVRDLKTGFGLNDRIYWHTVLWTTDNYSAIADLHTSQFTVTHALGFSVFTSRILATDL